MNNKNNNVNRNLLDQQRNQTSAAYNQFLQPLGQDLNRSREESTGLRNQIRDKYTNSNGFMPAGLAPNANGFFNLPSSGGVSGDFGAAKEGYQKFADTGGINRGDFDEARGSYSNFIRTGGLGEGDKANLRSRVSAQIPAFYKSYADNAKRRQNVQGGYAPGFDAQMAEIGRESARGAANATRLAEADIVDRVQQGKMFGTSGSADLATKINSMEQSGRLSGLGGLESIAGREASLADSQAGRNQAMQLALLDMYQRGGLESAQGLQSLYNSAPGDVGQSMSGYLQGLGGLSGNNLNNLQTRSNIQDRTWMDLVNPIVGAAAGGFTGGLANRFARSSTPGRRA